MAERIICSWDPIPVAKGLRRFTALSPLPNSMESISSSIFEQFWDTVDEFGQMSHWPSRAKTEMRVCAGKTPAQWSVRRWRLMAHAIATFWRCVFCRPRYRDLRRPAERTPCENVPLMPARML